MSTSDSTKDAPLRALGAARDAKAETLRRVDVWKRGAAAVSVAGFIAISGVIIDQQTSTTSSAVASVSTAAASSGTSSTSIDTQATATPTTQDGGYSFGNSSSQQPVAATSAS